MEGMKSLFPYLRVSIYWSVPDDKSLSLNQDTNQYFGVDED